MKILFLVSRFLDGGIDTVLVEYLNSMVRLTDHHVTLAISIDYGKDAEVFTSRIDKRVEVKHIITNPILTYRKRHAHHSKKNILLSYLDEALFNGMRRLGMLYSIRRLIKDCDAVIDFDSCHSHFIPAKSRKTRIAFYHFSLKKEMERQPRHMKRFLRHLQHYDHVVTISDAMKEEATAMCRERAEMFCRIYNCIDTVNLVRKASLPDDLLDNTQPYMLAIERLEESQKDLTTLINAYALACSYQPSLPQLYIIGEGQSRDELEKLIRSKGLEEKVHMPGFISNPLPWIKRASFIVHSAKFEGLPTVLIEALLLKKIIISTDCPTGPREILDNGKAGILTPVGDAQALAEAMLSVFSGDADINAMTERACRHGELFKPESSVSALLSLIKPHSDYDRQ